MSDTPIQQKPVGEHVGSFALVDGGRCEIYTRRNRVTLFFHQNGKASAFHMTVPGARAAADALHYASEVTPYDEGGA